jgi:transposase
VEQFELIRRDYFVEGRSIRWIARMRGVHRRTVRQAIVQAWPSVRRTSQREPKVLTEPMRQAVQAWLQADEQAPPKQRHTGRRIYRRLAKELDTPVRSRPCERCGVAARERDWGEVFVPQVHAPGVEAEVDWREAAVDSPLGGRRCHLRDAGVRERTGVSYRLSTSDPAGVFGSACRRL